LNIFTFYTFYVRDVITLFLTMVLTFYYDLLSQPCRAVYMFLKAADIEFESKVLQLTKGEHMTPEVLAKNPFHKVPFIVDGDFVLAESNAIIRYVARKYKVAEKWLGESSPQRAAKVDEFLSWYHLSLRKPCVEVFFNTFVSRAVEGGFPKRPLNQESVDNGKKSLASSIKHIDEYFLGDNPYIGGKEISVADLQALNELGQLKITSQQNLYEDNPKIKAWLKRVEDQMGPIYAPTMERLNGMTKNFKVAK